MVSFAGLAALLAVSPTLARATVTCGQKVDQPGVIELDADLTCSASDGIDVESSDVVIDLKGHTISGTPSWVGVHVKWGGPYSNVEIRNGTIRGFGQGVRLDTADDNHVWNLTLVDNVKGVDVANANQNLIEKNRISGCTQDAVRLGGNSTGNRVVQNTVSGNAFGLSAADDATANLMGQNQLTANVTFGIGTFGNASATIVSRNTVSGSIYDGIRIHGAATDTVVKQNTVTGSGLDGIAVWAGTAGTVVIQNTSSGNADDGIDVDAVATEITKNTASRNGDYGIEAVSGVTDGGGNSASGNGNPAQCTGVSCSP